jgi:hypothetical protein
MDKPEKSIARCVRQAARVIQTRQRLATQHQRMAEDLGRVAFDAYGSTTISEGDLHREAGKLAGMVEMFREFAWENGADPDVIEEWLGEINTTAAAEAVAMLKKEA